MDKYQLYCDQLDGIRAIKVVSTKMSVEIPRPFRYTRENLEAVHDKLLTTEEIPDLIKCDCFTLHLEEIQDASHPNSV